MAIPWKTLDSFKTEDETLELRQRGHKDYLITLGNQILMNSMAQRSEIALGKIGCRSIRKHPSPRVLVGGLGMGCTLRAVLDSLPENAEVVVSELSERIVEWCQGPLSDLTDNAVSDTRVRIELGDVADHILKSSKEIRKFDSIILDLYRGPHARTNKNNDPFYGSKAIQRVYKSLVSGGTFAVWGENHDEGFMNRMSNAGFSVSYERPGKGGYRHVVFVGKR